jgi:hypothetical protein
VLLTGCPVALLIVVVVVLVRPSDPVVVSVRVLVPSPLSCVDVVVVDVEVGGAKELSVAPVVLFTHVNFPLTVPAYCPAPQVFAGSEEAGDVLPDVQAAPE